MKQVIEKALLSKVERLEAFEEKAGIRFENISVTIQKGDEYLDEVVNFYLEAHPINGTTIDKTIEVQIILYDQQNFILGSDFTYLIPDRFFGFELVNLVFREEGIIDRINKIRIFPKTR